MLSRKAFLIVLGSILSAVLVAGIIFIALLVKFALMMAGPSGGCRDEPNFVIEREVSPDGKWVAERVDTTCGENESQHLWLHRPNETLVDFQKFPSVIVGPDTHFTWSDDGRLILYGPGGLVRQKPTGLRGVSIVYQVH